MKMNINEITAEIIKACKLLSERSFVANHDGNISCKTAQNELLITPSSFAKRDIKEDDLIKIDLLGNVLSGKHKVPSEMIWHLAIYRVRPDISSIVHGHPVTASAFGLTTKELGTPALPEAIVSLGRSIKTLKFFSPLDSEMMNKKDSMFELELGRVLKESDVFIAAGNGAWSVGDTVMQTYLRLELVEQVAKQHHLALQLGEIQAIPEALVSQLLLKRPKKNALKDLVREEILAFLKDN
jgi:L-fuculose-phosphate aldolase